MKAAAGDDSALEEAFGKIEKVSGTRKAVRELFDFGLVARPDPSFIGQVELTDAGKAALDNALSAHVANP